MNDAHERAPAYAKKDDEQYTFDYEPIRGYPELRWTGKRPFRGTSYYPAQLKESFGDSVDGWRNKIYWGDNLQVMSHLLREYRGKVRLCYIDPPFDSKADYKKRIELRGQSATGDASAFEEKQYSDIWTNDEYLQFMYERLILMRELLADDGSIYVHLDWHKCHYLRIIMDEIFGISHFSNEINWIRTASHNDTTNRFSRVKDSILFYSKTDEVVFNDLYLPYSKEYIDSEWNNSPSGRFYKYENMLDPRNTMKEYDFHGTIARWRTSFEKMEVMWNAQQTDVPDSHGRIKLGRDGKPIKRCRIIFLDEMPGVPLSDSWNDISYIAGRSIEGMDYPTQKPEALLERIIKASSNPGDLVFDCFMGSGTTQAVAMKLGRRFLGADINLGAIQTTTKRLLGVQAELKSGSPEFALGETEKPAKFYTGFEVYTVNNYDFFRNELDAKKLLIEALEIQELPGNMLWDGEQDGWMVKILAVNRLATAADLESVLSNLDYKAWEKRAKEHPERPVERIRFVCLGHDPDLRSQFLEEMEKLGYKVEVGVLDILRDKKELQFKRESEAKLALAKGKLEIKRFYPMNLLQKLSLEKTKVGDWRELVDSVLVDWNYDGALFSPSLIDIPEKNELVKGVYEAPEGAGTIRVKITDLLSESWEGNLEA